MNNHSQDGRLTVVDKPMAIPGGSYLGVNSFGWGGSNTHAILRTPKLGSGAASSIKASIPRIVLYAARVEEGLTSVLDKVDSRPDDGAMHKLLSDSCNLPTTFSPYRG